MLSDCRIFNVIAALPCCQGTVTTQRKWAALVSLRYLQLLSQSLFIHIAVYDVSPFSNYAGRVHFSLDGNPLTGLSIRHNCDKLILKKKFHFSDKIINIRLSISLH